MTGAKSSAPPGVQPYAISRDSPWTHVAWMQALDLDFPLLSDWNGDATHGFGVAFDHRGLRDVSERSAFLIDGTASSAARGATSRPSSRTSTSCSKPRPPCSRPTNSVYSRAWTLPFGRAAPASSGQLTAVIGLVILAVSLVFAFDSAVRHWYAVFRSSTSSSPSSGSAAACS